MPEDRTLVQWVALSLLPNLGGRTLANLLDHFATPDAILAASRDELLAVPRIGPKLAGAIQAVDLDRTDAEIAAWQAAGIELLLHPALHDTSPAGPFPAALATLPDAPPVLFQRGTPVASDSRAVAIVGTRHPSPSGRAWAGRLAGALALRGWTIVSGLAAGIDTAAHEGALEAGGSTVVVLGCGVNVIYPSRNAALAARITTQGALLSEVHPDAPPSSPALVARNRIISGLARAIIVVEAGSSSGSLHAARFARVQDRRVYALDHDLAGNRKLIADGACVLPPDFCAWDDLSDAIAGV